MAALISVEDFNFKIEKLDHCIAQIYNEAPQRRFNAEVCQEFLRLAFSALRIKAKLNTNLLILRRYLSPCRLMQCY